MATHSQLHETCNALAGAYACVKLLQGNTFTACNPGNTFTACNPGNTGNVLLVAAARCHRGFRYAHCSLRELLLTHCHTVRYHSFLPVKQQLPALSKNMRACWVFPRNGEIESGVCLGFHVQMGRKYTTGVALFLAEIGPEKVAMLLKKAALAGGAACEQVVGLSQREVVGVKHQDLVKGGDIGQDEGFELEGEALEIGRGVVPGVGDLSGI